MFPNMTLSYITARFPLPFIMTQEFFDNLCEVMVSPSPKSEFSDINNKYLQNLSSSHNSAHVLSLQQTVHTVP